MNFFKQVFISLMAFHALPSLAMDTNKNHKNLAPRRNTDSTNNGASSSRERNSEAGPSKDADSLEPYDVSPRFLRLQPEQNNASHEAIDTNDNNSNNSYDAMRLGTIRMRGPTDLSQEEAEQINALRKLRITTLYNVLRVLQNLAPVLDIRAREEARQAALNAINQGHQDLQILGLSILKDLVVLMDVNSYEQALQAGLHAIHQQNREVKRVALELFDALLDARYEPSYIPIRETIVEILRSQTRLQRAHGTIMDEEMRRIHENVLINVLRSQGASRIEAICTILRLTSACTLI